MQVLVQAILSVSGESKTPNLNDCVALRGTVLQSSTLMSYDSRYMVDFSQKYQSPS